MSFDPYEFDRSWGAGQDTLGRYTAKTFLWMFLGLLISFAAGLGLVLSGGVYLVFSNAVIPYLLMALELVVVVVLSARIHTLSVGAATGLFLFYAALNGVVIASALLLYGVMNVLYVFALTALYFGVLAVYGLVTKSDLSRLRPILISGLIFLVVFWLLSIFLPLSSLERMVSLIGIAVFLGFTAYDTRKIRDFYQYYGGYPDMMAKASIFSALQLYLDFINLFLYLLRFLGSRRR